MNTERSNPVATLDPHARLEREFITAYVADHLPPRRSLRSLSPPARRQLLVEASRYASAKLAELETRAHLVEAVHGAVKPGQLA